MDRKVVVVYKSDNNDMGRALTKLEKGLKEFKPTYIARERLTERDTRNALVIIAGGDGTLLGASHRILDNYSLVLGVKLSEASRGYYAATDLKGVNALMKYIINGKEGHGFTIERLPRLECVMHTDSGNWVKTDLALNEFLIANTIAYLPSKHILRHELADTRVLREFQWSSGILVCTSQGYTGWASKVNKQVEVFPHEFYYFLREEMNNETFTTGVVRPGERIYITSDMHRGYVVPDSFDEYHFNRGTEIEIRMSDRPLNIIRRKVAE
jgi:NAD kinase